MFYCQFTYIKIHECCIINFCFCREVYEESEETTMELLLKSMDNCGGKKMQARER